MGSRSATRGATAGAVRAARLATTVAVLVLGLVTAADAQPAHPNYVYASTFSSSGTGAPDQLLGATGIAIDPASHDVLVTDPGQNRVAVFRPDGGTSATYLTEFGRGDLSSPAGIAVDVASGDVYVSDAGNNRIVRYVSDGAPTPTYTLDAGYTGPAAGTATGQVKSFGPIAVDQQTHELLVADQGNERISRYSATGAFVSSFDRADAAGRPFRILTGLAVGSDRTVYVVDAEGDVVFGYTGRVRRFNSAGAPLGPLDPLPTPRTVTANRDNGMVLSAGTSGISDTQQIYSFIDGDPAGQVAFPSSSAARGLAVDDPGSELLYSVTTDKFGNGTDGVDVYSPVTAPGVETTAPSDVTATAVTLRGSVDPGGSSATPHFEYSTDAGATWTALADLPAVNGTGEQPISEPLADLAPNTSYLARVVATNADTSSTSRGRTFTTATAPPAVKTGTATDVTATSARLNGTIDAYGLQTTYFFEYGPTADYGTRLPAAGDGVAGAGRQARVVSRVISGLTAGTTYHVRLVAQNAAGTTRGPDVTFVAADATAGARRGLEQVTPVDKAGASVDPRTADWQSSLDGNALVYRQSSGAPGSESAVVIPRFLGQRADAGWTLRALDPPFDSIDAQQSAAVPGPFAPGVVQLLTVAVSRDLSHVFVASNKALTPDAPAAGAYLYVRDTRTGSYALVASGTVDLLSQAVTGTGLFYAGARDFSTVYFTTPAKLTPDALADPTQLNLYRWSDGRLSRADVLPNGATTSQGIASVDAVADRASADGDRVAFYVPSYLPDPGVYLRSGDTTTAVSVSRVGGQPTDPQPGSPQAISPDGRYFFFSVETDVPLTADAPAASGNVYRYDVTSDTLRFVSVAGTYATSDDGTTALVFVPGSGYHLWRDGQADRLVLATTVQTNPLPIVLSDDGAYAGFLSPDASPDGEDNVDATRCRSIYAPACVEAYLYDVRAGTLRCASCRADGGGPAGDASFGTTGFLSPARPRNVSSDGELFFDTPTDLVAGDVNGRRDVYEYVGGRPRLLSGGRDGSDAQFGAASPSGDDVFFATTAKLVRQDRDDAVDVYDARVGGGLAAQDATPSTTSCSGGECREPSSGPGPAAPAPSQTAGPPRTESTAGPPPARVTIRSARVDSTRISLVVKASGPGRLRVSGTRVTTVTRTASAADSYTLRVPLTAKTRAARRAGKTVTVAVTVSLTPAFGARGVAKLTRTLRK